MVLPERLAPATVRRSSKAIRLRYDRERDATAVRRTVRISAGEGSAIQASGVEDHTIIRTGSRRAVKCRHQAERVGASALWGDPEDRSTTVAVVACQVATAAGGAVQIPLGVECQSACWLASPGTVDSVEGVRNAELPLARNRREFVDHAATTLRTRKRSAVKSLPIQVASVV